MNGACSLLIGGCLSSLVAIAFIVTVGECYSGRIDPDPANGGKCVYHEEILKLGANPGPSPCERLTCLADGTILIEGCGKLRIESCNRGERLNTDRPYPECCKLKYKCKRPDGSSYYITKDITPDAAKIENST